MVGGNSFFGLIRIRQQQLRLSFNVRINFAKIMNSVHYFLK